MVGRSGSALARSLAFRGLRDLGDRTALRPFALEIPRIPVEVSHRSRVSPQTARADPFERLDLAVEDLVAPTERGHSCSVSGHGSAWMVRRYVGSCGFGWVDRMGNPWESRESSPRDPATEPERGSV